MSSSLKSYKEMDAESSKGFMTISQKSFSERVKSAFFETVCFIGIPPAEKEAPRMAILRLVLIEVRWFLQLLPYLEEEESKDNGSVVKTFWIVVSCIRPDMIMSYLQAAWVWLILVWVGVIACWLLFAVVFCCTLFNKRTHPRVRKLLQIFGQLLLSLISVPSANILLSTWFPDSRFGNGISLAMRQWAGYISLLVYLGLVCFQSTMILANFEFDITQKVLRGKSEMDHDFMTLLVAQTTMLSYYLLYSRSRAIHYLLTLLIAASLAIRCYRHLPYYRCLANGVTLWSRSAFAWCSFAFLVGDQVSPLCSLMLVVVLTVSTGVIVLLGFETYQSSVLKFFSRHMQLSLKDFEFDLGIRFFILEAIQEPDGSRRIILCRNVIDKIDLGLKLSMQEDRKRLILVKYIIYLNLIKDERAARVCLSQALMLRSSITSSFLEFKAKWMLSASSELEEILFLRYLEKLEGIKREDKTVCLKLNDLWNELGSQNPDKSRVVRLSKEVDRGVSYLKTEFKLLIKNFPSGFESYDLFGSFVSDVLGRAEEGKRWMMKAERMYEQHKKKEEKDDSEYVSFFDPQAGVILADTNSSNFGSIVFMNLKAADHLKFDLKAMIMYKLNAIIPPPYNFAHLKSMKRFVDSGEAMLIAHPDNIPFLKATGFILFCAVKMYLTSNGHTPLLAIAFKPLKALKEGAILSDNMVIQAHTENFPKYAGFAGEHVEGGDLNRLRPNFLVHRHRNGTSLGFRLFSNHSYCGMFTTSQFSYRTLYFFYVFKSGMLHSDKECTKWDFATYDYKASFLLSSAQRSDNRPSMFFQSIEGDMKENQKFDGVVIVDDENPESFSYKHQYITSQLFSRNQSSFNHYLDKENDINDLAKRIGKLFRWSNYLAITVVQG